MPLGVATPMVNLSLPTRVLPFFVYGGPRAPVPLRSERVSLLLDLFRVKLIEPVDKGVRVEHLRIEPLLDRAATEQEVLPGDDLPLLDRAPAQILIGGIDAEGFEPRLHYFEVPAQDAVFVVRRGARLRM